MKKFKAFFFSIALLSAVFLLESLLPLQLF